MLVDDALALLRNEPQLTPKIAAHVHALLQRCPRFVLDDNVTRTVMHLGLGDNPAHLVDMLEFARMPYPVMWVEYLNAPRQEVIAHYEIIVDSSQPARVGWLLEQGEDSRTGRATVFWKHASGKHAETASAQLYWDFRSGVVNPATTGTRAQTARCSVKEHALTQHSAGFRWRNQPREFEAYVDTLLKFWFEPAHLWLDLYLEAESLKRADVFEQMLAMGGKDVGSESLPILAALLLLNSRNATEATPSDLKKLNRARTKSHKPPFMEHRTVSMRIPAGRQRALERVGIKTGAKMPLHLCRGHFKRRKRASGEYDLIWWNAHLRGDPAVGTVKRNVHLKTPPQ